MDANDIYEGQNVYAWEDEDSVFLVFKTNDCTLRFCKKHEWPHVLLDLEGLADAGIDILKALSEARKGKLATIKPSGN